ncbi:MAG: MurR/RpiR family transcriptional regulator [Pseudomonadota bacterium]
MDTKNPTPSLAAATPGTPDNRTSDLRPIERPDTFDALRRSLRDQFPNLSPHLQRIARAALEEPNGFAFDTTAVISEALGIQPSTLIRFAKHFGYSGFSEMQRVFRQRLIEGAAVTREKVYSEVESGTAPHDVAEILQVSIQAHVEALERFARNCDTVSIANAVRLMREARHIYIAGLRRSRPIADYLAYGLIRSERACSMLDFSGGMASPQIATMAPEDLLIAIAFPPYSVPVVDAVMDAFVSGRRVLAITDTAESPLARHAATTILVEADAAVQLQPISAAIGLVQTLVTATGQQ